MIRPFPALFMVILLAGCHGSEPVADAPSSARPMDAHTASERQFQDIKTKMGTMTPAQRADYIRTHPEEFANLGRTDVPSRPNP